MSYLDQILDFFYVIFQRRLSSARYLMKSGGYLVAICLGIGSLAGSISKGEFILFLDSNSSPIMAIMVNCVVGLGIIAFGSGLIIELFERIVGEAADKNRSKSVDLRSLPQSNAPNLNKSYPKTIESSGVHNDLYLHQHGDESLADWLCRSAKSLGEFSKNHLESLNQFEVEHPVALGAQAHVPHCFALGFLISNRRLVNYYCWNRDNNKHDKGRWIDCRDKRTRGQTTNGGINIIFAEDINDDNAVKKLGLSIEISFGSDPDLFLERVGLDSVCQIRLENQYVGNLFSEKEQVKIVTEVRNLLNNVLFKKFRNIDELHITVMAQSSFVMRLGADFNQNHFPRDIYVHHYEKKTYPWCFKVRPGSNLVEYSIMNDDLGKVA